MTKPLKSTSTSVQSPICDTATDSLSAGLFCFTFFSVALVFVCLFVCLFFLCFVWLYFGFSNIRFVVCSFCFVLRLLFCLYFLLVFLFVLFCFVLSCLPLICLVSFQFIKLWFVSFCSVLFLFLFCFTLLCFITSRAGLCLDRLADMTAAM